MSAVFVWALKAAFVLAGALLLSALLRRYSAASRHSVLAAGVVAVLLLPAVSVVAPEWRLPPAAGTAWTGSSFQAEVLVLTARVVFAAWALGLLIGLLTLLVGLSRLGLISRRADLTEAPEWDRLLDQLRADLNVRRPVRLLFNTSHTLPITWGVLRPRILLPFAAQEWPEERRRIVLLHELAHIERGDWFVHLAADLTRAAFWFNPLAWMASRRVRLESERACDDRVIESGVSGLDYATQLLELARGRDGRRDHWMPAPAIVRPSSLERRVRAMLTPGVNRAQLTATGRRTLVFAAIALALALGGATAAQTFATFAGSVVDPLNGSMPAVTFVLTNRDTGAKHEVQSDRNGRVELQGLTPGDYIVEASLPGFMTFRSNVRLVEGQRFEPAIMMQVGELEETVTATDGDDGPPQIRSADPRPVPPCRATGATTAPRIGGNIRAPLKIRSVAPQYPVNLRGTGRSGVVELRGRIGTDGILEELTTIGDADPDFEASALAAAREWRFDQTLLNCVPWPVNIRVHVQFAP